MRKLSLIVLYLFCITLTSFSQKQRVVKQPYVDYRSFHMGFHIGFHTQDLFIKNSQSFDEGGGWFAEVPGYKAGVSLGIILDKRICSFLNLRFIPGMHLGSKEIVCKELTSKQQTAVSLHSYYLQFPLEIKYQAIRIHNYSPYLTAGGYAIYDLGKQKHQPVRLAKFDYGISIGVGCDLYLNHFKFAPEIRFCFGLRNLFQQPAESHLTEYPFVSAFAGLKSRMIMIVFNFE